MSEKRPPVIVSLNVEGFSSSATDTYEIDRDEWDGMSRKERAAMLDDAALSFANDHVSWGWHIANPDDEAATG